MDTPNTTPNEIIDRISDAIRDIGEWISLAERQREKMNQNLGWCPTEWGIERSKKVASRLALTIPMVRSLEAIAFSLDDE